VSGSLSIAVAVALLVAVCAAGFVLGELLPLKRRARRVVLASSGDSAEYLVLAGRRVIDRSATFPAGDEEAARAAFEELVARRGDEIWQAEEQLIPA
jgi:hypothetical protein